MGNSNFNNCNDTKLKICLNLDLVSGKIVFVQLFIIVDNGYFRKCMRALPTPPASTVSTDEAGLQMQSTESVVSYQLSFFCLCNFMNLTLTRRFCTYILS